MGETRAVTAAAGVVLGHVGAALVQREIVLNRPGVGRRARALVLGGMRAIIDQSIEPKLRAHSIEIAQHFASDKRCPDRVPASIDLVICFVDMYPAQKWLPEIAADAKRIGIPLVRATHKYGSFGAALDRLHYPRIGPVAAAALRDEEADPVETPPEPQPRSKPPKAPRREYPERVPQPLPHPPTQVVASVHHEDRDHVTDSPNEPKEILTMAPTAQPANTTPAPKAAPTRRPYPEVREELKRLVGELRAHHGMTTITVDELGAVEVTRTTTTTESF